MSRARDVLARTPVLDREHELSEHISRSRSDLHRPSATQPHREKEGTNDVSSEDLVGILLDEDLDEPVRVVVGLCARVGRHGVLPDAVLDALGLELLLVLADPCDLFFRVRLRRARRGRAYLGVGVDDGRNGGVVDVAVARVDELDSGNTCACIR